MILNNCTTDDRFAFCTMNWTNIWMNNHWLYWLSKIMMRPKMYSVMWKCVMGGVVVIKFNNSGMMMVSMMPMMVKSKMTVMPVMTMMMRHFYKFHVNSILISFIDWKTFSRIILLSNLRVEQMIL